MWLGYAEWSKVADARIEAELACCLLKAQSAIAQSNEGMVGLRFFVAFDERRSRGFKRSNRIGKKEGLAIKL